LFGVDKVLRFYEIWSKNLSKVKNHYIIRYERMKKDINQEIHDLLKYMNYDIDDPFLNKVTSVCAFDRLRDKKIFKDPYEGEGRKIRRGVVGGYVDYLSESDIAFLNERVVHSPFCSEDWVGLE
jgi:hypothetical protein